MFERAVVIETLRRAREAISVSTVLVGLYGLAAAALVIGPGLVLGVALALAGALVLPDLRDGALHLRRRARVLGWRLRRRLSRERRRLEAPRQGAPRPASRPSAAAAPVAPAAARAQASTIPPALLPAPEAAPVTTYAAQDLPGHAASKPAPSHPQGTGEAPRAGLSAGSMPARFFLGLGWRNPARMAWAFGAMGALGAMVFWGGRMLPATGVAGLLGQAMQGMGALAALVGSSVVYAHLQGLLERRGARRRAAQRPTPESA